MPIRLISLAKNFTFNNFDGSLGGVEASFDQP